MFFRTLHSCWVLVSRPSPWCTRQGGWPTGARYGTCLLCSEAAGAGATLSSVAGMGVHELLALHLGPLRWFLVGAAAYASRRPVRNAVQ